MPYLTGLQWHILSSLDTGGTLIEEDGKHWLCPSDGGPAERIFPLAFGKLFAAGYIAVDLARQSPLHWCLTPAGKAALLVDALATPAQMVPAQAWDVARTEVEESVHLIMDLKAETIQRLPSPDLAPTCDANANGP